MLSDGLEPRQTGEALSAAPSDHLPSLSESYLIQQVPEEERQSPYLFDSRRSWPFIALPVPK